MISHGSGPPRRPSQTRRTHAAGAATGQPAHPGPTCARPSTPARGSTPGPPGRRS